MILTFCAPTKEISRTLDLVVPTPDVSNDDLSSSNNSNNEAKVVSKLKQLKDNKREFTPKITRSKRNDQHNEVCDVCETGGAEDLP